MWNPFSKSGTGADGEFSEEQFQAFLKQVPGGDDLNFVQKMALKKVFKMPPAEREKYFAKMFQGKDDKTKEAKSEALKQLEDARKRGQMSDDQYRLMKKKLGLE